MSADDFNPDLIHRHHGRPLYECPNPEHDVPLTTPGRVSYATEAITYYQASGEAETRVTDRDSSTFGGSAITYITCEHLHTSREAAEKCAERLIKATVKAMNQANGVQP